MRWSPSAGQESGFAKRDPPPIGHPGSTGLAFSLHSTFSSVIGSFCLFSSIKLKWLASVALLLGCGQPLLGCPHPHRSSLARTPRLGCGSPAIGEGVRYCTTAHHNAHLSMYLKEIGFVDWEAFPPGILSFVARAR